MATDMSVHPDFMKSFQHLISGVDGSICTRQILICQAIMKCADISNPVRCRLSTFVAFRDADAVVTLIRADRTTFHSIGQRH